MAAAPTTDLDAELTRIAAQWRHAELNGWTDRAEAHRQRLDLLLDEIAIPSQRDTDDVEA